MLEPFRAFVGPPTEHCWQRLRPVMIIKCRERAPMKRVTHPAPRIVAAGQLHHAGHQHQFEEKKLEQEKCWPRDRRGCSRDRRSRPQQKFSWPKSPGRKKDG